MPSPVFRVSAMTYRDRPILPVVAAGEPVEENHTCWGLTVSAQLLWELREQKFPVTTCFCPFESAAHWLVVTVSRSACAGRRAEDLVQELARIVFRSRAGSFIPKIILLEDDVDPANLGELVWAFATRNHPGRGVFLFPDEPVLPLVAFLDGDERRAGRGTKAIYNCLTPDDGPAEKRPRRSSFRHLWPREIQTRVIENWKRYGLR
jgi:4-hydroxy-3-polyprenylbenzoate decarboxylase